MLACLNMPGEIRYRYSPAGSGGCALREILAMPAEICRNLVPLLVDLSVETGSKAAAKLAPHYSFGGVVLALYLPGQVVEVRCRKLQSASSGAESY